MLRINLQGNILRALLLALILLYAYIYFMNSVSVSYFQIPYKYQTVTDTTSWVIKPIK